MLEMPELPDTMDRCLATWAERTPDALAVVFGDLRLTHGALRRAAMRWADALRRRGVGPGSMVGLHIARSHHTVIGIVAILEIGASYVPLEPSHPGARLRFIAEDAGVQLIVTESALADELGVDIPTLCVDVDAPPRAPSSAPSSAADARPTPSDVAYVTYTSGSTGQPKGVPMPHRGICRSLRWLQSVYPYGPDDRALFKSPLGFDVSSRWEILWPLASGGAVVIARPGGTGDPAYLARLIEEESVSVLHFVPSMLEVFVEEPAAARCRSLRRIFSGGEALSHALERRLFARLPECELIDIYGATETIVATHRRCTPGGPAHDRPRGRPLDGLPLYLLDDTGQPVALRQAGEIHVGGDFLAQGYLNQPALSAERFIPCPPGLAAPAEVPILFKTGDWARLLDSGELEHLGRRDHQVKIRGVRIELSEIEAALESSPLVARAVVVARTPSGQTTKLTAFVRCTGDVGSPPVAPLRPLREHLGALLPPPMIPAEFVAVDAFALNANGKIDRRALERALETLGPAAPAHAEPNTATEVRVAAIWRRLLGAVDIGRDQDFMLIGGNSLLAMRLLVHLRSEFDVELSPLDLATGVTVAELAQWIDAGGAPTRAPNDMSVAQMRAEVRLARDLRISQGSAPSGEASEILLTGATGFLGAFVLSDLLSQTDAVVSCLVRGDPSSAHARLARVRERYGLRWSDDDPRIRLIRGDLGRPALGLDPAEFAALGRRVGAIYHVGAQVNEATPYRALRAVNVDGTHELIRLASLGAPAHLHFVSTTAVFESSGYLDAPIIEDDAPLDGAGRVYGGYAQSKWIAEALIEEARERGLPASIYRPGSLSGHSHTGRQAWDQLLGCLLRGILVQGAAPAMDVSLAFTPVDFASQAIVHLSRQPWARNGNFNLVNPESITLAELVERARALGYAIASQPHADWVATVNEAIVADARHPLSAVFPLLTSTIPGTERSALAWSSLTARMQCRAAPRLARAGVTCPAPNDKLLSLYLRCAAEENARS